MSYSDNSPERRNLVLLSTGIILFHIGDARLTQDFIKLPLTNIEFHNLPTLTAFMWALLVWFTYRFFTAHPDWRDQVASDFKKASSVELSKSVVFRKVLSDNKRKLIENSETWFLNKRPDGKGYRAFHISTNPVTKIQSNTKLDLPQPERTRLTLRTYTRTLIRYPNLVGYFFPYALALAAVFLSVLTEF